MNYRIVKTCVALGLVSAMAMPAQAFFGMGKSHSGSFSDSQEEAIQEIVKSTIHDNPKLIIDAVVAYQKEEQAKKMKESEATVGKHIDEVLASKTPAMGNPNADVLLYEFLDYRCGHCKQMAPRVEEFLKSNKEIKVVIKELPIFGGVSTEAAKAALAAERQGKFAQMHAAIFKQSPDLDKKKLIKMAEELNLNIAQLKKDMADPAIEKAVNDNLELSKTLKIMGTPALIMVNSKTKANKFFPGEAQLDQLNKAFEELK